MTYVTLKFTRNLKHSLEILLPHHLALFICNHERGPHSIPDLAAIELLFAPPLVDGLCQSLEARICDDTSRCKILQEDGPDRRTTMLIKRRQAEGYVDS